MPGQTSPWKFGVWPLALALVMHALPWWMLQRGGSGEGVHDRVVRFREVRLQPRPPERDLSDVLSALAPKPEAVAPDVATAVPAPVEQAPKPGPAEVAAPVPAWRAPEPAPSLAPDPGNGHPPGWVFDPESYVPVEDLDEPPQLIGEWVLNEAAVPQLAKDRPSRVRMVVRMWVSAEGHVDIYQILDADPVVPWLEALLKDLDKSTLKPAMRDGQSVGASWMVEMDIDLVNGF